MTELSPAAKAVDDAFWKTISDKWNMYDKHRAKLAAALRAAVAIVEFPPRHDANPSWNAGFDYAQKAVLGDLLAIADELDGIKYGTYRCSLKDKPSND